MYSTCNISVIDVNASQVERQFKHCNNSDTIIPVGVCDFLTLCGPPWRLDLPTGLRAKWLKRRGFTQGMTFASFAVKSLLLIPSDLQDPQKGHNLENSFTQNDFRL